MMNKLCTMCLSALLAAACTGSDDTLPPMGGGELSDMPILLSAGVAPGGIEVATRAAVDGGASTSSALTLSFALANDNNASGAVSYGAYGATFTATRASVVGNTATVLTGFSTAQYYLANGRTSKITGWYPAGTYASGASAKVSWTLTGQEDVMVATAQAGSKSSAMPALAFRHKLAQVQVYAYATDATAKTLWGNITSVTLTGQNNACSYALSADAAGTVAFTTGGNATFTVSGSSTAPGVGASSAVLLGTVMMEPKTAALSLDVTTAVGGQKTVPVASREYLAGNAYKITLKLDKSVISPSATIGGWTNASSTDKEVVM